MSRLFIIGNGYDNARRKDTTYVNFKQWIEDNYLNGKDNFYLQEKKEIDYVKCRTAPTDSMFVWESLVIRKTKEEEKGWEYRTEPWNNIRLGVASAVLIDSIEENNWNKFETELSKLPLMTIIEKYRSVMREMECTTETNEEFPTSRETELFTSLAPEINRLFTRWILSLTPKSIEKGAFERDIIQEIRPDDTFLIFNYTRTIEDLFNNRDATIFYHIHGTCEDVQTIVFGHNEKEYKELTNLETDVDCVKAFYACMYKNSEAVIKNNQPLWDRIASSKELDIYEFGWSCQDSDKDYLQKIVEITKDKRVRSFINNHNNGGDKKKKRWQECGLVADEIHLYDENQSEINYLE